MTIPPAAVLIITPEQLPALAELLAPMIAAHLGASLPAPAAPAPEEFLTVSEAAGRMKVSPARIYDAINAGTIKFTRVGRKNIRVHASTLGAAQ